MLAEEAAKNVGSIPRATARGPLARSLGSIPSYRKGRTAHIPISCASHPSEDELAHLSSIESLIGLDTVAM
jgi:hypothetical protein